MKALILAFTILSATVYGQDKPNTFSVKATFPDAPSTKVILGYYLGDKTYSKDSSYTDASGKLTFSSGELLPQGQYLFLFPEKERRTVDFFLGNDQQFMLSGNLSDTEGTIVATGSADNEVYFAHLKQLNALRKEAEALKKRKDAFATLENPDSIAAVQKRIEAMDKRYYKLRDDVLKSTPGNAFSSILSFQWRPEIPESMTDQTDMYHYYKAHYFDKADWNSKSVNHSAQLHTFMIEYIDNLTVQDPDSIIAACDLLLEKAAVNDDIFQYCLITLTNKYARSRTVCFDKIYVHLVDRYYASGRAFWMTGENLSQLESLQKNADKLRPNLCGATAYNFNLKSIDNDQHTELRKITGNHILLLVYDPLSQYGMQQLETLAAKRELLEKKGVTLVTICLYHDFGNPASATAFIEKHGARWCTNLAVANEQELDLIAGKFGYRAGAEIFILDDQKRILYKQIDDVSAEQLLKSFPDK